MNDDLELLIYFPNGELNTSYVLANANLLLKAGEAKLAAGLFLRVAREKRSSFNGFYGLAQCFMKMGKHESAVQALRKAFQISRKPYVAFSLIEAALNAGQRSEAEQLALECAVEFVEDMELNQRFRDLYLKVIQPSA